MVRAHIASRKQLCKALIVNRPIQPTCRGRASKHFLRQSGFLCYRLSRAGAILSRCMSFLRKARPFPGHAFASKAFEASWRSGYAEDCKSLHPGSIPGEASINFLGIENIDEFDVSACDSDF